MIDKSQDYKYQNSTIVIWYLSKTSEGNATFNTNSVATFQAAATEISFVVREETQRHDMMESEMGIFHLWRAVCPNGFLPALSDKLYDGQYFWLVEEVQYVDRDDLLPYNRYQLTCRRSKLTVVP